MAIIQQARKANAKAWLESVQTVKYTAVQQMHLRSQDGA
jgi:hypothetical protein